MCIFFLMWLVLLLFRGSNSKIFKTECNIEKLTFNESQLFLFLSPVCYYSMYCTITKFAQVSFHCISQRKLESAASFNFSKRREGVFPHITTACNQYQSNSCVLFRVSARRIKVMDNVLLFLFCPFFTQLKVQNGLNGLEEFTVSLSA